MPTWFIGPGKTTRILQLRGGSEQKQQNKRFTLLGAQFGRISLTSRTTWQNICVLSSFLSSPLPSSFAALDLFSIMEDLVSFFSSFFLNSRWEVYRFAWKICFSCDYNKCSDWRCSMKTAVSNERGGDYSSMGGTLPDLSAEEPQSNPRFQMKTKMLPLPYHCSGH